MHRLPQKATLVRQIANSHRLFALAFSFALVATCNPASRARGGWEASAEARCESRPSASRPALTLLREVEPPRLEVLRRIRADERTKSLPVVVLTASKEEEDIARSYSLGANAYVRKPVEFAAFAEAAKALGILWLQLNEPAPGRKAAT
jgi:two-component system response regulator